MECAIPLRMVFVEYAKVRNDTRIVKQISSPFTLSKERDANKLHPKNIAAIKVNQDSTDRPNKWPKLAVNKKPGSLLVSII